MPSTRQRKSKIRNVSLRLPDGDYSIIKKAAAADKRSVQKFAHLHLVDAAKKTLQLLLPTEP